MNNKIIKYATVIGMVALLLIVFSTDVWAQCPMCRMSAESNLENGGTAGKGLNAGILYMLATPYLIVGALGFIWWRNRKRNQVL
jgi:hypothetical protein